MYTANCMRKRYYDNSLCVPGPETELLGQAAKEVHAYVSIGVSERGEDSATLYNSNIVFSPEGELLNVHRKLKPTGAERLVYGDANKDYFPITDTPWGPMGNLICWESYMPLARVALYQKGITLYISPNTNDNPEWQDTIKHIAIEGHCFFINADMVFTKEMYPKDLHCPQEIEQLSDIPCRGGRRGGGNGYVPEKEGQILREPPRTAPGPGPFEKWAGRGARPYRNPDNPGAA